tara:strand:+ start:1259 stop:1360 length:102 start_codon:yes stop_codon:yes gene_type:complete
LEDGPDELEEEEEEEEDEAALGAFLVARACFLC